MYRDAVRRCSLFVCISKPTDLNLPVRPTFVRPCAPISAARPPAGKDWLHQPKWDGYGFRPAAPGWRRPAVLAPERAKAGPRPTVSQGGVPFMRQVQTFPNGQLLFEHCAKFGFEGVVSKRLDRPYVSGPCKCWVKVKCPEWRRDNQERFRMFEGR